LSIPLTIYAVQGLEKHGFLRGNRFKITVASLIILSMMAIGYSISAFSLGSTYTYPFLPSGLVQSSVPFADIPDIESAFTWASGVLPMNVSVIVPEQFQGFAATYLRSDLKIRVASPSLTLDQARLYYPIRGQLFAIYYSNEIGAALDYVRLTGFGSVIVCEFRQ